MVLSDQENIALKKSEERYRMLVEHSLQGLAILHEGRIVFCNSTYAEMLGYTPDEVLAMPREEVERLMHPADRETIWNRYRDRLAGRQAATHYEHRMLRKDGSEIWVEARATLMDYDGQLAVQVAYVDITDRKTAEIKLRESNEYLDLIINSLGDAILVKDRTHRVMQVNDLFCRMLDSKREDIVGKTTHEILSPKNADRIWKEEEQIFQTGESCLSEEDFTDKNGVFHAALTKKTLVTDRNGNKALICSIRDISEHKKLQDQFIQAQKMEAIGILASGIAHDFNNLLNVINGYSELIIEELSPDSPLREDAERVREAGLQAASLTSELMVFGRKQAAQSELLNLNEIIEDARQVLQRLVGDEVKLSLILEPKLGVIQADPGQMHQVIMNMAVNSRDAMPHGGCFTVETANAELGEEYARKHPVSKPGSYVVLCISDNGSGMDAETQAHLFEPFFTTKEKGKGTGLGLSSVYGIIKQTEGFIEVASELGVGTRFKIYIPKSNAS